MREDNQTELDFYQTIPQNNSELINSIKQAEKQQDRVISIFKIRNCPLTPYEVWAEYCKYWNNTPITSIRRAISNLAGLKKLRKTDNLKKERLGKPNYTWEIIK